MYYVTVLHPRCIRSFKIFRLDDPRAELGRATVISGRMSGLKPALIAMQPTTLFFVIHTILSLVFDLLHTVLYCTVLYGIRCCYFTD